MKSATKKGVALLLMYGAVVVLCISQKQVTDAATFLMNGIVVLYATITGLFIRDMVTNTRWHIAALVSIGVILMGGLYCVANVVMVADGISRPVSAAVFTVCMFAGMVIHSIRQKPQWGVLCLAAFKR